MPGPTQLNLFTNHITLDNEYMRCDHKRQVMTKLLRTKNNKIPEIGYFLDVPGRIRNSYDNFRMHHEISRGAPIVD